MEPPGANNELTNRVSKQIEVTKCLIESLHADVDSPPIKIEPVLGMISKNLVFDDPGLLATSIILDEKQRQLQDETVMWLINQVLYIYNKHFNT